ncbi:MAG: hypothetical protein AAF600_22095 [Bacteroidota bacterium]
MGYFGGLGAGKGWYKFKFVLEPETLKNIFEDLTYWFAITNGGVPIDYEISKKTTFFEDYENLFGKITSEEEWNREKDWQLKSKVMVSIIDNKEIVEFKQIKNKRGETSEEYKSVEPKEPVINLGPFSLYLKDSKLSIETMNDKGTVGLQLSYPKVVSFGYENHEYLYETNQFSNFELFNEITARIKKVSHKAKLSGNEKVYRPNFWVDNSISEEINNNFYLKENNLKLS